MTRAWSRRRESLTASGSEKAALIRSARQDLEKAIGICRDRELLSQLAQAFHLLANIERDTGDSKAAESLWEEAISVCRKVGEPFEIAHKIRHLGDLHKQHRRFDQAEACYSEALNLYRHHEGPPKLDLANALNAFAELKAAANSPEDAISLWQEASDLYAEEDVPAGITMCTKSIERLQR